MPLQYIVSSPSRESRELAEEPAAFPGYETLTEG